jgi:hypothetical protein
MTGQEKIKYFFEKKTLVHVSCNGRFYNGTILEVNEEKNLIVLMDNKIGGVPILFEEILNIEPMRNPNEN